MNSAREQAEILRAAIVLAVADGVLSASERGLLAALAKRVGVAEKSLDKMVKSALTDAAVREKLFQVAAADPELTLELLVAAAQIDGQLHALEEQALAQMAEKLDVPVSQLEVIHTRGMARADAIRARK